ncbi:putative 1,4-beta-D-xylan synthase [Helianthus debilis subsp. tardiflorus]
MHMLMNLPYDVVWIVVEAGGVTNETAVLLERAKANSNVRVKHIGFDKKMPMFGMIGIRVVREEKLDGIVMFADDSNMHTLELFDEIQKVEWIGAVSVGFLVHSSQSDQDPFEILKNLDVVDEKKPALSVQGPACNSSDQLIGWHTFDSAVYKQKTANYIGDMALVLSRKLEWCGFVMNSKLVCEESEFRPEWIKDVNTVVAGDVVGEIENPLSFLEDASMVEPLGSCGKKVMLWWLRAEARADSKFPSGWIIDPQFRWIIAPQLEVTVAAKRTPWPEAPTELPSNTEKEITTSIQENVKNVQTKTRTTISRLGNRKHGGRNTDASVILENQV